MLRWLYFFLFTVPLWASAQFKVPALTGPVVDKGGVIDSTDEVFLEHLIRKFHQLDKGQVQVLTVQNLGGIPIEQASIQVTDQWKLGTKEKDDGVLIFVSVEDRRIRIEVGQGLEGVLTDLHTKQIIEDVMVPIFRSGSPSQGILAGTYQVMKTIDPSFEAEGISTSSPQGRQSGGGLFGQYKGLFFLIFIIFMILSNIFRPRGRSFWGSGLGGGGWGGGGFGGGGFGGGGGWSGGGGGFSGGGSSGSW